MLKVPRSTYYAAKNRPLSNRKLENDEYCRLIMEIWEKSKQRYGYPKIAAVLRNEGYCISNQRVWRLMCTMGIKSVVRKNTDILEAKVIKRQEKIYLSRISYQLIQIKSGLQILHISIRKLMVGHISLLLWICFQERLLVG